MFSDLWIFTQFERVAITLRDSKNKSLCVRKNMQFHGKITKSKLILCFSFPYIFSRFFHKDHLPKSFVHVVFS